MLPYQEDLRSVPLREGRAESRMRQEVRLHGPLYLRVGTPYTGMVRGRFSRFLAVLLLLWTAVDLSIPAVCRAEGTAQSTEIRMVVQAQTNDMSNPAGYQADDDCFCCCSHIMPAAHFHLASAELSVPAVPIPTRFEPFSLAQSQFHPPRH